MKDNDMGRKNKSLPSGRPRMVLAMDKRVPPLDYLDAELVAAAEGHTPTAATKGEMPESTPAFGPDDRADIPDGFVGEVGDDDDEVCVGIVTTADGGEAVLTVPVSDTRTAARAADVVPVAMPTTLPCRIHGQVTPVKAGQVNQMVTAGRVRTWYRFRCPNCNAPRFATIDTDPCAHAHR